MNLIVSELSDLVKSPKMFGSTYSVEVVKPLSFFEDCLSSLTIFGVYYKNKITGLVIITALLHKDLKCKAPLIEPNLRRNLGKWST